MDLMNTAKHLCTFYRLCSKSILTVSTADILNIIRHFLLSNHMCTDFLNTAHHYIVVWLAVSQIKFYHHSMHTAKHLWWSDRLCSKSSVNNIDLLNIIRHLWGSEWLCSKFSDLSADFLNTPRHLCMIGCISHYVNQVQTYWTQQGIS